MTLDHAVALSLVPDLSRRHLTERLRANDPALTAIAAPRLAEAAAVRSRAAARGIHVAAWHDPAWPAALHSIPDMPPALWYRGRLDVCAAPAVAIVGSRAASAVALETAWQLAADLARRGIVVVSGLARGVDSAAHRGALEAGRTVAVLGSGLERLYPAEHRGLAEAIARDGLVLTEFPPDRPALPFQFPLRNRLISGLARAVVVIEASDRSGSLITAACALDQGRDVMAVPGNVLSGRNRGGHALIRDGAKIVESADDIVGELGLTELPGATSSVQSSNSNNESSGDCLLDRMAGGQDYDLDALASLTGLGGDRLLARLFDLELRGLVRRVAGGRFVRPT